MDAFGVFDEADEEMVLGVDDDDEEIISLL